MKSKDDVMYSDQQRKRGQWVCAVRGRGHHYSARVTKQADRRRHILYTELKRISFQQAEPSWQRAFSMLAPRRRDGAMLS